MSGQQAFRGSKAGLKNLRSVFPLTDPPLQDAGSEHCFYLSLALVSLSYIREAVVLFPPGRGILDDGICGRDKLVLEEINYLWWIVP